MSGGEGVGEKGGARKGQREKGRLDGKKTVVVCRLCVCLVDPAAAARAHRAYTRNKPRGESL